MKGSEQQSERDQISPAEWAVAVFGALIVIALIGFLVYDALRDENLPPLLETSIESIEPSGDAYLVEFLVQNSGDATAAGVTIEAELRDGSAALETHTTTLDYVPAHSRRAGGVLFARDPAAFDLEVRATGYQNP